MDTNKKDLEETLNKNSNKKVNAEITAEELRLLDLNDEENSNEGDDELLNKAKLDKTDEDGDPLNEEDDLSGRDLDVPGADADNEDEEIGEEDEENNDYSGAEEQEE